MEDLATGYFTVYKTLFYIINKNGIRESGVRSSDDLKGGFALHRYSGSE